MTEKYFTDIWGEFAIWSWGKVVPKEVGDFQTFMKRPDNPLFIQVSKMEDALRKAETALVHANLSGKYNREALKAIEEVFGKK